MIFPDLFPFSSYNCFSDRISLTIYAATPIATGFTLLFGPHLALNLPHLRTFSLIANLSSIKPFLNIEYWISFIGYLFIKWVKGKTNYHSKERIFLGTQYTKKAKAFNRTEENSASKNNENHSSSIKKLKILPILAATDLSDDHYIIINFLILQELIKTVFHAVNVDWLNTSIHQKKLTYLDNLDKSLIN